MILNPKDSAHYCGRFDELIIERKPDAYPTEETVQESK
jgi:hypothetical protein